MGDDDDGALLPSDLSNANGQEEVQVHDYQDSLESKSKPTTPQENDRRNDYDYEDFKYDPSNLQHKQYFLPQAYPPPSLKMKEQVENPRQAQS